MKVSREYWYNHSHTFVENGNCTNYVNMRVAEGPTAPIEPGSDKYLQRYLPPTEITTIQSVMRPAGMFLCDGIPVNRHSSKKEKLKGGNESLITSTITRLPLSSCDRKTTFNDLSIPKECPPKLQPHIQIDHLRTINHGLILPEDKPPIWDKFYNRLETPIRENLNDLKVAKRKWETSGLRHIYWDNNYLKNPAAVGSKAHLLHANHASQIILPSLLSYQSKRRMWELMVDERKESQEYKKTSKLRYTK